MSSYNLYSYAYRTYGTVGRYWDLRYLRYRTVGTVGTVGTAVPVCTAHFALLPQLRSAISSRPKPLLTPSVLRAGAYDEHRSYIRVIII